MTNTKTKRRHRPKTTANVDNIMKVIQWITTIVISALTLITAIKKSKD